MLADLAALVYLLGLASCLTLVLAARHSKRNVRLPGWLASVWLLSGLGLALGTLL